MPALLPIDKAGLDLIKGFEGLHDGDKSTPILELQMDPIGIWTGGWGYAIFSNGRAMTGMKDRAEAAAIWAKMYPKGCTLADADALLAKAVGKTHDRLAPLIKVQQNQNQSNALISLAYNVGVGIADNKKGDLADSSLIAGINAMHPELAVWHFMDWVNAGGKKIEGLVRRRRIEAELYAKAV